MVLGILFPGCLCLESSTMVVFIKMKVPTTLALGLTAVAALVAGVLVWSASLA